MTVIDVVALVEGSVMTRIPVEVPAERVRDAEEAPVIDWETMEAPVPPLNVNVGVPGVPGVHEVSVPERVTVFPVEPSVILEGEAEIDGTGIADVVKL